MSITVDRGPSCYTTSEMSPCPWCGIPTNYLSQTTKYKCNHCGNDVWFHHESDPQDPSQTIRVVAIKPNRDV